MIFRINLEVVVEIPDSYVVHHSGNIYLPDKETGDLTDKSDFLVPVLGFWSDETDLAIAQESLVDKVWGIKVIDIAESSIERVYSE